MTTEPRQPAKPGAPDGAPVTAAGLAHWLSIAENERLSTNGARMAEYRAAILAIEAEARASDLDVERLAHAISRLAHKGMAPDPLFHKAQAERIAAEYARVPEGEPR